MGIGIGLALGIAFGLVWRGQVGGRPQDDGDGRTPPRG